MFCCDVLRHRIESAGEKGVSIIVSMDDGDFSFDLQFRAISADDEARMGTTEIEVPAYCYMTLASSERIHHCVHCGAKLASLINPSTRGAFAQIADMHRQFFVGIRPREARRKPPRATRGVRYRAYVVILSYVVSIAVVLSGQPEAPQPIILLLTLVFGGFLTLIRCPNCYHSIFKKKSALFGISYWGGLPPAKCTRCGNGF
jgi:hypothetical protein